MTGTELNSVISAVTENYLISHLLPKKYYKASLPAWTEPKYLNKMLSREISTQVKDKCDNILSELSKVWQILQNTQQSEQNTR